MPYLQRDVNNMYRRVLAALEVEFTDIPADSTGEISANGLRAQLAIIEGKGSAQAGFNNAAQVGTDEREAARVNLRTFRQKLTDTARTIARKKKGFDENYPSPAKENDSELIVNSHAVAAQALVDEADFTNLALKKVYIQSGASLVEAFEASFEATDAALAQRAASVGGKKEAIRKAADFFAELNTYILNHYDDQPDKLHAWDVASRVERSAPKKKVEGEKK